MNSGKVCPFGEPLDCMACFLSFNSKKFRTNSNYHE